MKFYLISLGCAKNLVDSEKITEQLQKEGYSITDDIDEASFIFINTCGFIKDAKQESIDTIFTVFEEKPQDAKILVYGCLTQRYLKDLKELIPEVDLFLPLLPHDKLIKEIKRHFPVHEKLKCKLQKKNSLYSSFIYLYQNLRRMQ